VSEETQNAASQRRAVALVGLALGTVAFFAVTSTVARVYRGQVGALSREWSTRGEEALAAGRATEAVEAFETAQH
jgi:hypothetical protein